MTFLAYVYGGLALRTPVSSWAQPMKIGRSP